MKTVIKVKMDEINQSQPMLVDDCERDVELQNGNKGASLMVL